MGLGVSFILVAAGAVLIWAVDATVSGLNIHSVGVVLVVVGIVGLIFSLMFWPDRRTTFIQDGGPR